jgi:glycosyltransferase involved in cell wall biosynthesis
MFDALAAGRPVLINVPGWLGDTVEKNRAGRMVDPFRPSALADSLCELADNAALAAELGRNARALAESQFSRVRLAEQLEGVLLSVTSRSTA